MTTYFISDLHLDERYPEIIQIFSQFLKQKAARADALYILGDLFEYWIGDDHATTLSKIIIETLQSFSKKNIPVYFMHGNRDFLIGNTFAAQTGMQILSDPTVINLYGLPTLLMHGDTLCTDDVKYLEFRKKARDPKYQKRFLNKPLWLRKLIARALRMMSKRHIKSSAKHIMDVTASAVTQAMQSHRVSLLIHGHTHRPAIHNLTIKNQSAQRIVLGAWHQYGNVLTCSPEHKFKLQKLFINTRGVIQCKKLC